MSAALRTFVLRGDSNAQALWGFLKNNWRALADAGKPLAIEIREHRAQRSAQANKRYWALLNEISASAWMAGKQFSPDAWHEFAKRKFIGTEELPDGSAVGISSASLNVEEFAAYMTRVECWAAEELGVEFTL